MNKFLRNAWLGLVALTTIVATGCGKDDPAVEAANPSIEISGVKATSSTVTFTLTAKEAVKYSYTVVMKGLTSNPIVVEGKTTSVEKVEGLSEDKEYVISAIAQAADGTLSKAAVTTFVTNAKASVAISDVLAQARKANFSITPVNADKFFYVSYETAKKPATLTWVETKGNDPLLVQIADLTPETDYTIEAYATNAEGDGKVVTKTFKTAVMPDPVTVTASATVPWVAVKFELDKLQAAGFYNSSLINLDNIGPYDTVKDIATFIADIEESPFMYELKDKETSWTMEYGAADVTLTMFVVCVDAEGVILPETAMEVDIDFPANNRTGTGTATAEVKDIMVMSTSIEAEVAYSANTVMQLSACVAKSMALPNINMYVNGNLANLNPALQIGSAEAKIAIAGLKPETDYYFYTISVDQDGKYGSIVTSEFSTGEVVIDPSATVKFTPIDHHAYLSIALNVETTGDVDPSSVRILKITDDVFVNDYKSNPQAAISTLYDSSSETLGYLFNDAYNAWGIQYDTKYHFFALPVTRSGGVGVALHYQFSSYKYTPAGTASVTLDFKGLKAERWGQQAIFTITPNADCAEYLVLMMEKEIYDRFKNNPGEQVFRDFNTCIRQKPASVLVDEPFSIANHSYLVVVACDKDGNWGTAVVSDEVTHPNPPKPLE